MKIMNRFLFRFLIMALFSVSYPLWAEDNDVKDTQYVTDKLRLSLYKKADSNSGTIKLLISGDRVQILERTGPYSRIRTEDGETGWVKNGFLVSQATDSFLLLEEQEKNRILSEQLGKYSNTKKIIEDYENTISLMTQDIETIQGELNQSRQEQDRLTLSNSKLQEQIAAYDQEGYSFNWTEIEKLIQHFWYFALSFILILFLLGYLFGKRSVEAQLRRRFQGVKVL